MMVWAMELFNRMRGSCFGDTLKNSRSMVGAGGNLLEGPP